jgi:hypothetical protein
MQGILQCGQGNIDDSAIDEGHARSENGGCQDSTSVCMQIQAAIFHLHHRQVLLNLKLSDS